MRVARLELTAFGPFTDAALELGDGAFGLHLVCGPNEAGKSSALRALRQFLYGIETRSRDDFVHGYASLRIGAVPTGDPIPPVRRYTPRQFKRSSLPLANFTVKTSTNMRPRFRFAGGVSSSCKRY